MRSIPVKGVLADTLPPTGSSIALYWPLSDEVDTRPFIAQCIDADVRVYLPVVAGTELLFRRYEGSDTLVEGAFSIQEPTGAPLNQLTELYRIYVPGVAFTPQGARLGRGAGYYDRFLQQVADEAGIQGKSMPEVVGVCTATHLVESLPTEAHDFRMHRVVTLTCVALFLLVCSILPSCESKKPQSNPAFEQTLDTTGIDDPYIYEGDSAWNDAEVERREQQRWRLRRQVHRTVRAPYLNKEKGIISIYDDLFRSAAAQTGWDWRIIAAQCYQESGFDPMARSGAGARGLMQIMPSTAQHLSLPMSQIHNPSANVAAAARYIRELSGLFQDIRSHEERILFVLAAYNGGYQHIRDAMALTRKYGGSPQHWADVSGFVLRLQQPRYYHDPVVRRGYMIGSETTGYVASILQRARQYGASFSIDTSAFKTSVPIETADGTTEHSAPQKQRPTNRFTRHNSEVLSPDELMQ